MTEFRVGDVVAVKTKKTYEAAHLAEHAGKVGRITRVGDKINIHLLPQTIGYAAGVTRGRNSQGLRLIVGHGDIGLVEEGN